MMMCAMECGEQVDTNSPRAWRKVAGYIPNRPRGANQVRLAAELGHWIHEECLLAVQAGRDPRQEKLSV